MSENGVSRRQFLTGAAVVAAAAAVPLISNVAPAAATPTITFPLDTPSWTPLDPVACAREAYEIYKGKHAGQSACCEATYWPIIGVLAARYPDTWGLIPKGLFNYGGGGVAAWGASCGCTNGGPAVLKQMNAPAALINDYMHWYETTALPSNACYQDYRSGNWTPGGTSGGVWGGASGMPVPLNNAPKSRSQSVLCHASVTQWKAVSASWIAANPTINTQSDRCGKLCYDCVYKIATMINDWKAGATFTGALDPSVSSCTTAGCHDAAGTPPATGVNMTCSPCHTERVGDNHGL